jgi:hypothetical protein
MSSEKQVHLEEGVILDNYMLSKLYELFDQLDKSYSFLFQFPNSLLEIHSREHYIPGNSSVISTFVNIFLFGDIWHVYLH